jgi:hypothetical protein
VTYCPSILLTILWKISLIDLLLGGYYSYYFAALSRVQITNNTMKNQVLIMMKNNTFIPNKIELFSSLALKVSPSPRLSLGVQIVTI